MNNNRNSRALTVIFFVIVFFIIFYRKYYKDTTLDISNSYTIGAITAMGDHNVAFSFEFQGKIMNGDSPLPWRKEGRFHNISKGKRYLIKFSKKELWISELQVKYPVPDCVKEAPSEGWEDIPDFTKMCE
ncbi:MAG: hypothetical protein EAZ95_02745 [Bacteroidetes bacterium]|nr:MAG: hypothetical protein EAZ95_02745 [Bacteroidota bacterium]